ncbi:HAD family hydrolase [Burkholderia sp. JKS000303]|uniref:HAD family hydrolase n=1 Tax=Burkholderia sp. JKS000303 TaxID=1938747 RepID=UPI000BF7046F|nr:HAD family hydrolase [Burkholderia sp. JKS000303]PFH20397.1 phosphoglycolate phosphatase-like HAD superfamily hydrolase [Burkholderia sp. JKS000303]
MHDPVNTEHIKAIAFDFDGVILDSVQLKADLFVECYGDRVDATQRAAILAYQALHGGIGRVEKFRYFERAVFDREPDDATVATLANQYSSLLMARIGSCMELPGARAFLERMHGKLSLHLVSGTAHRDLVAITAQRRLDRYFETIVGSPTTKIDAFSDVVRFGSWLPGQVLAIGDSITELHAADHIGMPFVGIVAPGEPNPFPPRIEVFEDMEALNRAWCR